MPWRSVLLPSAFPRPRSGLVLSPSAIEGVAAADALSSLASLSRKLGVTDTSVLVDDEAARNAMPDAIACHDPATADLRYFDPGPQASDVPFGFTCGSCAKFVHWDDPRRKNHAFMASVAQHDHCPRITLTEQPIPMTLPLEEFIPQADQPGCDAFALNADAAPASVADVIERLDSLSFDELAVVGFEVHRSYLAKKHGERFGYVMGDDLIIRKAGKPLQVRVIGFQRKSGEEVIVSNVHDMSQVFTIPALRAR